MDAKSLSTFLNCQESALEKMLEHTDKNIDIEKVQQMVEAHGNRLARIARNAFPADSFDYYTQSKKAAPVKEARTTTPTKRSSAIPTSPPTAKRVSSSTSNTPTRPATIPINPGPASTPRRQNPGSHMMSIGGAARIFRRYGAAGCRERINTIDADSDDSKDSLDSELAEALSRK